MTILRHSQSHIHHCQPLNTILRIRPFPLTFHSILKPCKAVTFSTDSTTTPQASNFKHQTRIQALFSNTIAILPATLGCLQIIRFIPYLGVCWNETKRWTDLAFRILFLGPEGAAACCSSAVCTFCFLFLFLRCDGPACCLVVAICIRDLCYCIDLRHIQHIFVGRTEWWKEMELNKTVLLE